MSDERVAIALKASHVAESKRPGYVLCCVECRQFWPCDASVLAAEVTRLRTHLTDDAARERDGS